MMVAAKPTPPMKSGELSRAGSKSAAVIRCSSSFSPKAATGSWVARALPDSNRLGSRPSPALSASARAAATISALLAMPGLWLHAERMASSSVSGAAAACSGKSTVTRATAQWLLIRLAIDPGLLTLLPCTHARAHMSGKDSGGGRANALLLTDWAKAGHHDQVWPCLRCGGCLPSGPAPGGTHTDTCGSVECRGRSPGRVREACAMSSTRGQH